MPNLVLAIDGPSGSGKSSTAKAIALRANWSYLDTGALYRAVTYLALENKIESENEIVKSLESSEIVFDTNPADPKVFVNDKDVSGEIRLQRINDFVSKVSAMPTVRKVLLELQRKYIADAPIGIVVEGRDIGTVVAPHAQLKIYLHADIDERAQRRENEMIENSLSVTLPAGIQVKAVSVIGGPQKVKFTQTGGQVVLFTADKSIVKQTEALVFKLVTN